MKMQAHKIPVKLNGKKYTGLALSVFLLLFSCNHIQESRFGIPELNLKHFLYLYEVVDLPGNLHGGIVHIYSEYPDYDFAIEPDEGFTCVDDVARAMMIDDIRFSNNKSLLTKYDYMARFLLYMQADNGYFYNFLWPDLSINKTYRTSVAEPNWWSWRAFWALANYEDSNPDEKGKVSVACERLADNVFKLLLNKPEIKETVKGMIVPTWLPSGTAGDQSSVLMLGLEAYYKNMKQDERVLQVLEKLADGLVVTQKGNAASFPYCAFMSWKNRWHAYGNLQAYAMLKTGQLLNRSDYIESALLEIDNFYPYLIEEKFPANFSLKKTSGKYELIEKHQFPQIAYGFRPMIWACAEAYHVTGKEKYLELAEKIAGWFRGNNPANQQMYDPKTGRCYDGIVSKTNVNKNSGAESTIEALLSLQVFNKIAEE